MTREVTSELRAQRVLSRGFSTEGETYYRDCVSMIFVG